MQLWDVINYTPFAAFGGFERDHLAESYWCVWIKAAFEVSPKGHITWHDNPDLEISPSPQEIETPKGTIIVEDSDMSLPRPSTDISLYGSTKVPAHTTMPIRTELKVAQWSKAIEVHPPAKLSSRKIQAGPFSEQDEYVSLDWTNAFGGRTEKDVLEENPLGTGYAPSRDKSEDVDLPRLRYPGEQLKRVSDTFRPACYLPIPRAWLPRRELAGTFDDNWMKTRAPLLPQDHQIEYRNTTPADQRFNGFISGGEWVEMHNISGPNGTDLPKFQIPTLEFEVATQIDGKWVNMPMKIQSLAFAPGTARFSLLWGAAIPIGSPANDVKVQKSTVELRNSTGFTVSAENAVKFGEENLRDFGTPPAPEPLADQAQPLSEDA